MTEKRKRPALGNPPDYCGDKALANRLVAKIKAYWNKRGKYPQVFVTAEDRIFVVRSNMVGGLPQ